jgi:hypothetical protein
VITAEQWLDLAAWNAEACRAQCEAEDAEYDQHGRVMADEPEPDDA